MHHRRIPLPGRGVTLDVLEARSEGSPAGHIVLVHGFTGAKEDFADHLAGLAGLGWDAVAPDLRGHGGSDQPPGTGSYGLRIFAADVLELADALGWGQFTLLGHSMGGMIAQHIALDAGQSLDGLILMDTSHASPEGISPTVIELGKSVVGQGGMALLVEMTRYTSGALGTPAHERVAEVRAGYREFCEAKGLACSPDMWLAMVDDMLGQPDRLPALATIRVPTLVMVGDQDRAFLAASQRMARAIPSAVLTTIPDAGHSPQFENPEGWFSALSAFLVGLPRAGLVEGLDR